MTQISAPTRPSHFPLAAGLALPALIKDCSPIAALRLDVYRTPGHPASQGKAR